MNNIVRVRPGNKTSVITWNLPLLCSRVSYVAERAATSLDLGGSVVVKLTRIIAVHFQSHG